MRDAVFVAHAGLAPSIEAALDMDEVMRSAAVLVMRELEEVRRMQLVQAIGLAMGGRA